MIMMNGPASGDTKFPKPFFLAWLALSAAFLLISTGGRAAAEEMNRAGYTSSTVCGYCHADIYQSWKKSMHAKAYDDRTFQKEQRDAYAVSKVMAKNYCVKCHTPTVLDTGDSDANLPITHEGVGCDFCHTIEQVDLDNAAAPFKTDVGGQKNASMRLFGPHPNPSGSNPAAHQAAYADWFKKSELCGGCHEMTNANGLKIGRTYTEWKSSKYYGEGVQCQGCHMPSIAGTPYEADVKNPTKSSIPDHSLLPSMDKLEVGLEGDGMARVVQVKTFGKRIIDKAGNWLVSDMTAQVFGKKLKFNTSLKPMERREVRFVFANVPQGDVKVMARAFLTRNPLVDTEEHVHVPLGEVSK